MADTRCWRFRRAKDGTVEHKLFGHPDEAPAAEGWRDSPARVDERLEAAGPSVISRIAEAVASAPSAAASVLAKVVPEPPPPVPTGLGYDFKRVLDNAATAPDPQPEDDELERLRSQAEALGTNVDGRWRKAKLKRMIEAVSDGDDT